MEDIKGKDSPAGKSADFEALRLENETLAQQIRRLIKSESRLYAYQEQLDAQLREYKGLYELNRRLIGAPDIRVMFEYACDYVINVLEYERVLIFLQDKETYDYSVSAVDGYYNIDEREHVAGLVINHDDPMLSFLFRGDEYLICRPDAGACELADFRQKLALQESLIYPLVSHAVPIAFIVVGNSSENAGFYRRISDEEGGLLGMGNLVGLLSSSIENRILYENMNKALELVKHAEAKLRNIFENAAEGIFQTGIEGRILSCNPATASILGYESPDELIASVTDIERQLYVNPKRREELLEMLRDQENVKNFEVEFYRKDGSSQWTQLSLHANFDEKGEITHLDGIMLDISERKRAEELIRNSLHEKETLLREIHHRVKNNLQIINTLLDLQSYSISDEQARRFFNECQDRIRSMAMIHEKLYETVDFVSIDFAAYLDNLVNQLFRTYVPDDRISLTVQSDDLTMGIDEAIPCGLIVNELISNSLKHAFPSGGSGRLTVRLRVDEDRMITLEVADSGVGLSPGLDFRNCDTLGLQLVTLLVRQLDGELTLGDGPGTAFTIRFRYHPPA
jgi:PAS domain S-box-containing protein